MTTDATLSDKAFGFVAVPPRSVKPRTDGLTVVSDKGLGPSGVEDLLSTSADFLDWAKISMGTARILDEAMIRRKIAAYHAADVLVLLTGEVFELAVNQGCIGRVFDEAASMGFDGVEIASAQTILSLDAKQRLIERAGRAGLRTIAEVGQKGASGRGVNSGWLTHEAQQLRAAGADLVLLQGEGLTEDVAEIAEDAILRFVQGLGTTGVIYQAKDERTQRWYIERLGPEVSLDVDLGQVLALELSRRGLRTRGLFGLVANPHEEDMR
jgi:phosphosulfolactate synthase